MICRDLDIDRALASRQRQRALIEGRGARVSDFIINSYGGSGAVAPDPYWADVVALLHFDGPNGSTVITDSKGLHSWTTSGLAALSTAQSRFGGSSLYVVSSGDFISVAASQTSFGFGTGDFTVEGYVYLGNVYAARQIFDNRSGSDTGVGVYAGDAATNYDNRLLANSNVTTIAGVGSTGWTLNAWQHFAVTRATGTLRGFIEGNLRWTTTDSRTYASSARPFIGCNYLGTQPLNGYVDEVRITKGVARYTSAFTPPSAPFPNF